MIEKSFFATFLLRDITISELKNLRAAYKVLLRTGMDPEQAAQILIEAHHQRWEHRRYQTIRQVR